MWKIADMSPLKIKIHPMVQKLKLFLKNYSLVTACKVLKKNGWGVTEVNLLDKIYNTDFRDEIYGTDVWEQWSTEEDLQGKTQEENRILAEHDAVWSVMCDIIYAYIREEAAKENISIEEEEE